MNKFYITASCPYPNAAPHIGHALEFVQADFFARYYRLSGKDVFFTTGNDVHGLKIQRSAEKQGVSVEQFLEGQCEAWKSLVSMLDITPTRFLRTDEAEHIATAQAFWEMCLASGDIYKKRYQAWYDYKEEEFLGLVEQHPDPSVFGVSLEFIEKIDEENYFFALSRYTEKIIAALESGEYKVVPKSRLLELLNFVKEKGLQDISISREKSKLSWGVPVPGDESQVMYVWFDALTYYLTPVSQIENGEIVPGLQWPADLHCVGKDISRFHALLWPGMLLSAGLSLPKELLVHGFLTSEGQKMSKSIGNVIDPLAVTQEYGSDSVRWHLLKEVDTQGDSDFSTGRLKEVATADLSNDLGNLVSRVWTMCQKYREGKVPQVDITTFANAEQSIVADAWRQYHGFVEGRQINDALKVAHGLLVFCNKRIEELKPWALAKEEDKAGELSEVLYELLEIIRHVTLMLSPALVKSSVRIASELFPAVPQEYWTDFTKGSVWGGLEPDSALGNEQLILFPRT